MDQTRLAEVTKALMMIGSVRRNFLPADKAAMEFLVLTWSRIIEDVPTERVVDLAVECLRDSKWEPAPYDLIERYRRSAFPTEDSERATDQILAAATAASSRDPVETQREMITERLRWLGCRSPEIACEVAIQFRGTIAEAMRDDRLTLRAQIRRAYEQLCDRTFSDWRTQRAELPGDSRSRPKQIGDLVQRVLSGRSENPVDPPSGGGYQYGRNAATSAAEMGGGKA